MSGSQANIFKWVAGGLGSVVLMGSFAMVADIRYNQREMRDDQKVMMAKLNEFSNTAMANDKRITENEHELDNFWEWRHGEINAHSSRLARLEERLRIEMEKD